MTSLEFSYTLAKLRPELKTFTHHFTVNPEESQDLVQDTILKALSHRSKFREDTNLKGWLFTIMRNTFINQYRKAQRVNTSDDNSMNLCIRHLADEHTFNRPERSLEFKEVWRNMNSIREELLIPFKMYTTGYKYHEIAKQLNLPIGTIKNRIFHARKEIQKKLVGYHY